VSQRSDQSSVARRGCPVPDGNASLNVLVHNGPALMWAGMGYTTEEAQRAMVWFALTQLSGPLSLMPESRALLDAAFDEKDARS
jgi:hypothetical protein